MDYEILRDEHGEQLTCDSCGYPAPIRATKFGQPPVEMVLCEVCSSTHLGTIHAYYQLYTDESRKLAKSISWIANMLRDEIRRPQSG